MPFINSVLLVTITEDKVICTIKKKVVAVPRLFLANSEARKEQSQKKAEIKRPANDSNDWSEVLNVYENRVERKETRQKAVVESEWSEEQKKNLSRYFTELLRESSEVLGCFKPKTRNYHHA